MSQPSISNKKESDFREYIVLEHLQVLYPITWPRFLAEKFSKNWGSGINLQQKPQESSEAGVWPLWLSPEYLRSQSIVLSSHIWAP